MRIPEEILNLKVKSLDYGTECKLSDLIESYDIDCFGDFEKVNWIITNEDGQFPQHFCLFTTDSILTLIHTAHGSLLLKYARNP